MAVVAALTQNIHHDDDGGLDTTTVGVGMSVALPETFSLEGGQKPLANDLTWPASNPNCLVGDTSATLQQQCFVTTFKEVLSTKPDSHCKRNYGLGPDWLLFWSTATYFLVPRYRQ